MNHILERRKNGANGQMHWRQYCLLYKLYHHHHHHWEQVNIKTEERKLNSLMLLNTMLMEHKILKKNTQTCFELINN